MVPECDRCGVAMSLIDETTRIVEYRCPNCYRKEVVEKERRSR